MAKSYSTPYPIISESSHPVTYDEFVAVGDKRLDEVLEGMKSSTSTIESKVNTATGKIETNEAAISSLTARVGTAETNITGIDSRVTALEEGGSGGGTTNYNELSNKPQIGGTELKGNLSLSDIGAMPAQTVLTGGSQTSKSTADGGKNVYTFTKSDGTTSTLEVLNGSKGSKGDTGPQGPQGEQGIQGIQGPAGKDGAKGDTGATGPAGPAGADGKNGTDGKNGSNGVSCTHSWNGTTLTVTSASGTSSANLKGDKGDKGDTGATGATGPQGPAGSDANCQDYAKVGSGITVAKSVPADAKFTDTNTWRPLGTTADTACAGNDSRLSDARPANGGTADKVLTQSHSDWYMNSNWDGTYFQLNAAHKDPDGSIVNLPVNVSRADSAPASDVYAWAKAANKPVYRDFTETSLAVASSNGCVTGASVIKQYYNAYTGRMVLSLSIITSKNWTTTSMPSGVTISNITDAALAPSNNVRAFVISKNYGMYCVKTAGNTSITVGLISGTINSGTTISFQLEYQVI